MARGWIVQPHEPIEKLEPNLWTVRGTRTGDATAVQTVAASLG